MNSLWFQWTETHSIVPMKRFPWTVVDDQERSSVNETLEHINKTNSLHSSRVNKLVGISVNKFSSRICKEDRTALHARGKTFLTSKSESAIRGILIGMITAIQTRTQTETRYAWKSNEKAIASCTWCKHATETAIDWEALEETENWSSFHLNFKFEIQIMSIEYPRNEVPVPQSHNK